MFFPFNYISYQRKKNKKAVVTKIQSSEGSLFCLFCNKLSISAIVLI